MKLALYDMAEPELTLAVREDGWFPDDEINREDAPQGWLHIRRTGDDRAVVSGTVRVNAVFACDRCCRAAHLSLSADFEYHCIVGKEDADSRPERECREEDCYSLYLNEPVIDLGEILREQIYLAVPQVVRCSSSCRGLCPQCGEDLNRAKCRCEEDRTSSPFAVLRHLKGS